MNVCTFDRYLLRKRVWLHRKASQEYDFRDAHWMSSKARFTLLLTTTLVIHSAGVAKPNRDLQDVRATLATTLEQRRDTGDNERIQQLEPTMIHATHGRADRKGGILTLHFSNGKSHTYVTTGDCETLVGKCQGYELITLVSPGNFFLVHEFFYEGVGCLIVDSRTGRETELPDIPYLSPDGDRFLVVNGTDGGGGGWPLQIWHRRGDTAFVEWRQKDWPPPSLAAVSSVRWERNDRIDLKMKSESRVQPPPASATPTRGLEILLLTSQGWVESKKI